MSENMPPTGLVIDGAIFISEMLSYVHYRYYGISRVSPIPFMYRNIYREMIDFAFHSELGDAIYKRLLLLPRNHAANLTEFANFVGLTESAGRVHLSRLLRLHVGADLTDVDFGREDHMWSTSLLDWFTLLATVCFHLDRNGDSTELLCTSVVAGEILCNVMSGRPLRKMSKLREFCRNYISERPRLIV